MKTFLLSAAVIGGLIFQQAATAQAPATTTTATKPAATVKWIPLNVAAMGKDLELDRSGIALISRINETYNKEYAAMDKPTADQVGALTKRRDTELQKVLTKEQYTKWLTVRDAEAAAVPAVPKTTRKDAAKQ